MSDRLSLPKFSICQYPSLKAPALESTDLMSVTTEVFHLPISWLKALGLDNIGLTSAEMFHLPMS